MEKRRKQRAAHLEDHAAMNYATAASLINNGASEEYVQELRFRADQWRDEAAKLREPTKRRQRGAA